MDDRATRTEIRYTIHCAVVAISLLAVSARSAAQLRTQPRNSCWADVPARWYENPFVTTQPFKGLIVVNLLLNNWDWKTSNNKVYQARNEDSGPHRLYIVRDLGASLGRTTFPRFLSWTPFRFGKQGTRNDIGGFERQPFIKGVDGRRVQFDYRGTNGRLVDTVTVDDVLWTCRLMSRISDRQWRDVFRAAGYAEADQQRYITKLKSKMQEGLALASIVPKT